MRRIAPLILMALVCASMCGPLAASSNAAPINVTSPDGSVECQITSGDHGLEYSINFHQQPVIEKSPITVSLDGAKITDRVELGEPTRYEINETYPYRGVHSQAVNHCLGAKIPVKSTTGGTSFTLEVRVFNDGAAFRYSIPGDPQTSRVPDEDTTFQLPPGCVIWSHDLEGHYEGVHRKQELAEFAADKWAAPPMTIKLPGGAGYAAITEAALANYPGMALRADGHGGFHALLGDKHPASYPFRLRYKDDVDRMAIPAKIAGPIASPWRVVLVGANLNALVNSDVISNLCPPPDPALFPKGIATDWVKPGRAVWKYLDGGVTTSTDSKDDSTQGKKQDSDPIAEQKEFCRLAAELGFEYNVIEGFWRRWTDEQIKDLVDYGRQRGVGLIVWVGSKDMRDPQKRKETLDRCQRLGIAGLKVDFFDHEAKEIIDIYQALLKEGAEHHLLMDFHGSNKPTGEPRTWPNEIVREAIKGMEARKMDSRAVHDATLPFTRFLAGHGEYTPVLFGERRGDTTWAHQVADAVVFTAPLLTYGCNPKTMLESPCAEMFKSIPAVWDETIVLPQSEIGECAAFARRNGNTWFLAVVNGPSAKSLEVPLAFLGDGPYKALIVRGQPDKSDAMNIENVGAQRSDKLPIDMPHGGGFVARFTKD
jgi:alpha-glucosidase